MAEFKGMLSICDRCGATIFRRTTGDGDADGGYTRWNKFEPYPEGWTIVQLPRCKKGGGDYGRCCPACSKLWDTLITENFVKGTNLDPT